jgi:hypothetical protein
MGIIQDKAYQIAEDMNRDQVERRLAFDPMLIVTLVSVVTQIFKVYQECKKTPAQAHESIANPGILERWRLKRLIKKELDDDEMHVHVGGKMVKSTMKVGSTLTTGEVQQIYDEVGIPV